MSAIWKLLLVGYNVATLQVVHLLGKSTMFASHIDKGLNATVCFSKKKRPSNLYSSQADPLS